MGRTEGRPLKLVKKRKVGIFSVLFPDYIQTILSLDLSLPHLLLFYNVTLPVKSAVEWIFHVLP